jgi:adenylate cyclase
MPEKDRFGQDTQLAQVLEKYPVVLPEVASVKGKNKTFGTAVQVIGNTPGGTMVEYPGIIANLPMLQEKAAGKGIVNTFPEIDGVVRRMPLLIMSEDTIHPAMSLDALRIAVGDTKIQVKIGEEGVEALRVPKLSKITVDSLSRVWIDWSQQPKQHSLAKLPNDFNGEIVIVGLSAAGLVQPVATSRGEIWPQDLQASLLGTMISGTSIQRPGYADELETYSMLLAGILLIFLMRWTYVGIVATVAVVGGVIYGSMFAYSHFLYLFDSTAFAVGTVLVALHAYMVKFVSEFLQKQQIKKQFGSYLSPDLVAKLVKDPSLLRLGGDSQDLTIQFSDVRGFTSISEHYGADVQGLTKIMNRYMTVVTKVILENEGTLDKYIGDATMSFWNAPLDNHKHAKDSVKAALEMLDAVKIFNDEIAKEGVPPFGLGIGCNTGIVVVGNMGGEQRFDYTCLGDAVNLASRLEGQSKNYGVLIVLGPETANRLDNEFFTVELDCIAVKGKKEGVNIFTVFRNPEVNIERWNQAREQHNTMLYAYRQQNWDIALLAVSQLRGHLNGQMDNYYDLWAERINEMRHANLPADWDGVFRATSK